jgi:hypothetical protein
LQQITAVLQRERQQLRAERARLNEEFARLGVRSAQSNDSQHEPAMSGSHSRPASDEVRPLRLIVNMGSTGSLRLAELLSELSKLCRQTGGPGVRFEVRGARQWRPMEGEPGYGRSAPQHLVDVYASPASPPGEPLCETEPAVWNRFRSCLLLLFRSDSRLANFFELSGKDAQRDEINDIASEAARRAFHAYAAQRGNARSSALGIDAIQTQQDKVAELFEKLRSESGFEIELAPDPPAPRGGGMVIGSALQQLHERAELYRLAWPWLRKHKKAVAIATAGVASAAALLAWLF